MRIIFTFSALLLVGVGCAQAVPEMEVGMESIPQTAKEPSVETYTNERFGYTLEVPDGYAVYSLTEQQTAVPADDQAQTVFLVEDETNFFTIRGIENGGSAHEWLSQNLAFFYPTGDAAQRVGKVDGRQALFLSGQGTGESPARVAVFEHADHVIVVSYERESSAFARVLASLTVID